MSGYLEIKYPFKSNLGLNPFKSWKKQWCILRPSPTSAGVSLAVYCSEAGASAGTVELPSGSVVKRAKSRTRPYAFAVFSADDPIKPRVLLAAQSLNDTQGWMEKICTLLNGNKILDTEPLLKDSYSVSVLPTELSRKCGLSGDTVVTLSERGMIVTRSQLATIIEWKYITSVRLTGDEKDKACVIFVHSDYKKGGGELRMTSPLASLLGRALQDTISSRASLRAKPSHKLSKSDGDLPTAKCSDLDICDVRRSSWYSGPSEISLDDIDLVMSKESKHIQTGQLSRCTGDGELTTNLAQPFNTTAVISCDDTMSDRRSLASVASGIYEEIPDLPEAATQPTCDISCDVPDGPVKGKCLVGVASLGPASRLEEPTYECVSDCLYATIRRRRPPPLPPRHPAGTLKSGGTWSRRGSARESNVTRHSSLGSLPRWCGAAPAESSARDTKTLPKTDKRQPFSVFRKRLKSDSRIAGTPKSETPKENKDTDTKKKKFDFTPTRDIFKSFKVSRKMKNLKITPINLSKGETKSCEFLDETEHVPTNRCSKSVECLENDFKFEADLSTDFPEENVSLSIDRETFSSVKSHLFHTQQIVDLLLTHDQLNKIRLKEVIENDYMPMSPIVPPPPIEHHYIVMSPTTNIT